MTLSGYFSTDEESTETSPMLYMPYKVRFFRRAFQDFSRKKGGACQAMYLCDFVELSDCERIVTPIDMGPSDLSMIACLARYGFLGGREIRCKDCFHSQIFQRIGSAGCSGQVVSKLQGSDINCCRDLGSGGISGRRAPEQG